jgi:hypothetical protein
MQQTWGPLRKLAQDRQEGRKLVAALHTTGCNGQWHYCIGLLKGHSHRFSGIFLFSTMYFWSYDKMLMSYN